MGVNTTSEEMIKEIKKAFTFSFSDMHQMVARFHDEMKRGLMGGPSSLKMLPAFVDCPTGKETGRFIALDLGGTNFRVLQVNLLGNGEAIVEQIGTYVIPQAVTSGTGIELFDFIARSIQSFLDEHSIGRTGRVPLGFTFSFPVNQTGINRGILLDWTKDFSATDVINTDVVGMLSDALRRCNINNIDVSALTNDTVGTLIAKSYNTPDCDAGVIFGTGTNACYRECLAAILKLPDSTATKAADHMIVNVEWGNFNFLPTNKYDHMLDERSTNPGKQQMEKMISGMYLGELTRLVVMDLIKHKAIFSKHCPKIAQGNMTTHDISAFESDRTPELIKIKAFFEKNGMLSSSLQDRRCVRHVCRYVSRRAAYISAAAISAVVTWMDQGLDKHHTVAIDGTLYARYPQFKKTIMNTLLKLLGDKSKMISLEQADDGSGLGAAIASAVAEK